MIRMGIRARPPSVVRWSINKSISQLVNQSLLQSSFHKDPVLTKDFTEGPPDPIDGHQRSNSYKDFTEGPPGPIDGHLRSNSYNDIVLNLL
jgi:hypothetical protein